MGVGLERAINFHRFHTRLYGNRLAPPYESLHTTKRWPSTAKSLSKHANWITGKVCKRRIAVFSAVSTQNAPFSRAMPKKSFFLSDRRVPKMKSVVNLLPFPILPLVMLTLVLRVDLKRRSAPCSTFILVPLQI